MHLLLNLNLYRKYYKGRRNFLMDKEYIAAIHKITNHLKYKGVVYPSELSLEQVERVLKAVALFNEVYRRDKDEV
jgi:hypothetical protein